MNDEPTSTPGAHPDWIVPDWDAPPHVRAVVTTRNGGVSLGPYSSMNLGYGSGEDRRLVNENRRRFAAQMQCEPFWLSQVHGHAVADADGDNAEPRADAAVAREPGRAPAVLVADCLPVLICDRGGTAVAAAHAGWRGLASGVLEATVTAMGADPAEMVAWLGPAIGPAAFEVGDEVRVAFLAVDSGSDRAFVAGRPGKWYADLYVLARRRLARAGVTSVSGGELCTVSNPRRFYSYRRDGVTGRMAAAVWISRDGSA